MMDFTYFVYKNLSNTPQVCKSQFPFSPLPHFWKQTIELFVQTGHVKLIFKLIKSNDARRGLWYTYISISTQKSRNGFSAFFACCLVEKILENFVIRRHYFGKRKSTWELEIIKNEFSEKISSETRLQDWKIQKIITSRWPRSKILWSRFSVILANFEKKMRTAGIILGSLVLTCAVVGNAYYQKKQFYPSVVYITKSNPSMAVSNNNIWDLRSPEIEIVYLFLRWSMSRAWF